MGIFLGVLILIAFIGCLVKFWAIHSEPLPHERKQAERKELKRLAKENKILEKAQAVVDEFGENGIFLDDSFLIVREGRDEKTFQDGKWVFTARWKSLVIQHEGKRVYVTLNTGANFKDEWDWGDSLLVYSSGEWESLLNMHYQLLFPPPEPLKKTDG